MSERPAHYHRKHVRDLTPRQREVIELLAKGYTNAQVAEELGITLDGAKFHVREIMERLEVSSREEAVDVWHRRRQQPWLRLPAALPVIPGLAYAAGAAVAAAIAVGLVFLLLQQHSDSATAPDGGIYVAVVQPPPDLRARDWTAPIRVLELPSGQEREVGPPMRYLDVAWAPDGSRLAAIGLRRPEGDGMDVRLYLWTRQGELIHQVAIPSARALGWVRWSPDSTRLALLGDGIMVLDSEANELGWFPGPPRAGGGGGGAEAPREAWFASSSHAAVVANGLLVVADRGGQGATYVLPQGSFSFIGWFGERVRLVGSEPSAGLLDVYGTLEDGAAKWSDPESITDRDLGWPDEATRAELNALTQGRANIGPPIRGAGGQTEVFMLLEKADAATFDPSKPSPVWLVIRYGDERSIVDLGRVHLREMIWDIAIVPGWEGRLPAEVNASTPLPTVPISTRGQPNRQGRRRRKCP